MKNSIIALIVLLLIGGGLYFYIQSTVRPADIQLGDETDTTDEPAVVNEESVEDNDAVVTEEPAEETTPVDDSKTVIGNSIKGNPITVYHYGSGDTNVLFIGGIHGGYSNNTALVAFELMDYLEANPDAVPANVRVSVIPVLNPDGLERVTGSTGRFDPADVTGDTVVGRFNANDVDLNRNFDCEWQAEGTWRSQTVSGGSEPFSEPETNALRKFVRELEPEAVVAYYSAAGGVYSSSCNNGVSPETTALTNVYADAAGYQAFEEFDFYEITGDMVNWLAKENIPAISVLLTDHVSPEWAKNQKGMMAVINSFAQ